MREAVQSGMVARFVRRAVRHVCDGNGEELGMLGATAEKGEGDDEVRGACDDEMVGMMMRRSVTIGWWRMQRIVEDRDHWEGGR